MARRAMRNAQLFPTLNLSPIRYRAHLDVRASLFTFATDTVLVYRCLGAGERRYGVGRETWCRAKNL